MANEKYATFKVVQVNIDQDACRVAQVDDYRAFQCKSTLTVRLYHTYKLGIVCSLIVKL